MRKVLLTLSIFILSIKACYSQENNTSMIKGKWIYSDVEEECPDLIYFQSGGVYSIFNDCGSDNPKSPIIERGRWIYNNKKEEIIFSDRKYISQNSIFSEHHGDGECLTFRVVEVSINRLVLSFVNKNGNYIVEHYRKIKEVN